MSAVYLPVFHHFENGNIFTGSCGAFRYKITPSVIMASPKEIDHASSSIQAEFWHGPLCYERSEIEGAQSFPMSEQGRTELLTWLEAQL